MDKPTTAKPRPADKIFFFMVIKFIKQLKCFYFMDNLGQPVKNVFKKIILINFYILLKTERFL